MGGLSDLSAPDYRTATETLLCKRLTDTWGRSRICMRLHRSPAPATGQGTTGYMRIFRPMDALRMENQGALATESQGAPGMCPCSSPVIAIRVFGNGASKPTRP